jgi:hypothetical protein
MLRERSGKPKPDPRLPSPRMPEALYYYMFMAVEAFIVIGVWGFMRMGIEVALKGPDFEAPVLEQITWHLKSIWIGFADVCLTLPWVPACAFVAAAAVFVPGNKRSRKRMATIVSSVLVATFLGLIAMQFSEDIARAGALSLVGARP